MGDDADAGPVRSGLLSHWPGLVGRLLRLAAMILFRDPVQGAQTIIYCAVTSNKALVDRLIGKLVVDCRGVDVLATVVKYRDAERLWEAAANICTLDDTHRPSAASL